MWRLAQEIAHSDMDLAYSMQEMLQATIQKLITISGVFFLAAALALSSAWDGVRVLLLLASIFVIALVFFLARALLKRHPLLGLAAWAAGSTLAIVSGCWLAQSPVLALAGVVFPLVAAAAVSGWAGLAAQAGLAALVVVVSRPAFGGPLADSQAGLVIGIGAFVGLIGWIVIREVFTVSVWSIANFKQARQKLSEVRDRQVALSQAQEDLRLANSELARLSNRLKALEQIAEEARQATAEFVANVSHELRTPLNMIIGYADMISRSPKVYGARLPSALLTDIVAILRNAQHLSTLVNDVLDLSQVEAGRMAIRRDWAGLGETIHEALASVQGLFDSKALYLNAEVDAVIPPVYMDETRVRQVMINLLSNAGRFTEQGGVMLRCHVHESQVVICITDTGPGIARKDQERIFEPFQQADTSIRRRSGGSGLGLTISKQFIEMHGGKMWLESEPGEGTSFYFSLPLGSPPQALEPETGRGLLRAIIPDDETGYRLRNRPSQAPLPSTAERYVVVDPEQTLQRLLVRYLPDAVVETLPDVPSAIQALRQSPAQALILNAPPDTRTSTIPHLPYGTPAVTCWLPGRREAASRLGALEYLIKPISRERLLAALNRLGEGKKTVLIVDDEEDELHLFARYLEAAGRGYAILQVTNGQRALAMLRSRKPDVMLLDLTMPGMDGFQVLEEKQRDEAIRDIPVLVVSSRDPAGDPIVSDTITITQSGGISQRSLIACIQTLGLLLAPSAENVASTGQYSTGT
jgi:signal transduction histidine kinase/CheY-like chemotaxis protein